MDLEKLSYKAVLDMDIKYIRNVLKTLAENIEYDEFFGGWCIGDQPLREYFFEEEDTYLNPKELEGYMEEIIEDEMGLKR